MDKVAALSCCVRWQVSILTLFATNLSLQPGWSERAGCAADRRLGFEVFKGGGLPGGIWGCFDSFEEETMTGNKDKLAGESGDSGEPSLLPVGESRIGNSDTAAHARLQ